MLLITLLKAVGIEATEVLVQTRYTGAALAAPSQEGGDPAVRSRHRVPPRQRTARRGSGSTRRARRAGSGRCPSMDARAVALYVTQGAAEDRRDAGELARRARRRRHVDNPAHRDRRGRSRRQPSGTSAITRSCCAGTSARPMLARSGSSRTSLAGWFPTVEVGKDVDVQDRSPAGRGYASRYRAHSDGLARREGRRAGGAASRPRPR